VRRLFFAVALVACSADHDTPDEELAASSTGKPLRVGRVERWPEAKAYLVLHVDGDAVSADLGPVPGAGITAFWSIATTAGKGSAFFYAPSPDMRVAVASGITRVKDITDAAALDDALPTVGPVDAGGVVVFHHVPSGRRLAITLDSIIPLDPRNAGAGPDALADVTWYLTEPGSADFSAAP
jgi:hypothetical protein